MKPYQASSTAFTVLQGIWYVSQNPAYTNLVSDEVKQVSLKILSASPEGRRRLQQVDQWWFKKLAPLVERMIMPGITLHYVLRKQYIEDDVRQKLHAGTTQVINLGAGFDTLAYRLAKQFPQVSFIELDHPATGHLKKQALQPEISAYNNLHFLSIDFTTESVADTLTQSKHFVSEKKTVCILEGVFMYLAESQIRHILQTLKRVIQNDLSVIFTAMEFASKSRYSYGLLLKIYLKIKSEPLTWTCNKEHIASFLSEMAYSLQHLAGSQELRQRYLGPDHRGILQDGEYIAIADHVRPG
ncbi:MAG: SAM-dependent methyltransferase [Chloroflexota bacterium]